VLKERTLPSYSPSRAFLRALPFGPAFPTLSDLSDPISSGFSALTGSCFLRFPFRRLRLYQIFFFDLTPGQRGLSFRPLGRSDE
ncbi:hypothetical protein ACIF80_17260, partial [Streptomyces sp. NPDC085927]|uniref:hypothetical protein n=1 Tax=Streptomyces sp. NPDC085927 TaxID=3365738 RepID=UPI0037D8FD90